MEHRYLPYCMKYLCLKKFYKMTQLRLIFRNAKLTIVIWLLFPCVLVGQSTWIYGIQDEGEYSDSYLVKLNYLNGQYDTLLYLGIQNIDDFGSCIDPYNGRLFLSGFLSGQNGNLHEIDLNTLEIVSYYKQYYGRQIEYNFLNNSIIYKNDTAFWKFDLESHLETRLSHLGPTTSYLWGNTRTYNPVDNTYVWIDIHGKSPNSTEYFMVTNAFTGEQICKTPASIPLFSLVVDYDSGKQYGKFNGTIYEFNPYNGEIIELLTIPDYNSRLNQQQSVYDQVNKKYIVPYIGTNNLPNISVINMEDYTIDTTYTQLNSNMNLHQIYCKPKTYLSLINDTLYTSYGLNYQWYINGSLNTSINNQYFSPIIQGKYKTLVDYPEYSSLSNPVSYSITNLQTVFTTDEVDIAPNPIYDNVRIKCNSEYLNNSRILIINSIGELIYNSNLGSLKVLNLGFLESGLYTFIIEQNGVPLFRKKMIKIN